MSSPKTATFDEVFKAGEANGRNIGNKYFNKYFKIKK